MTNRERDSVARLLEQVAERLAVAPRDAEQRAMAYVERAMAGAGAKYAHQTGALEQACSQESQAIRRLVAEYLTPRTGGRGKR